ncbi:WD repeat-containing protein WDS-like protein, partial [Cucurbita argyrosperma subsp. sororia]
MSSSSKACLLQTTFGSFPTTSHFHFFPGNLTEQFFNLCNTFSTGFCTCKKIGSFYLETTVPRLVKYCGNWYGCIDTISGIKDLTDEVRVSALFLVLKHSLLEYSNCGDDASALAMLRKEAPMFRFSRDKIHKLAYSIFTSKNMNLDYSNDSVIHELRKKLLRDLEKALPPPTCLLDRRLEQLVETTVVAQIDSCMYHNFSEHKNEVWYVQFSNNGEYLASSSSDCSAIIWKVLEDGKLTLRHILRSHQSQVSFVAWSPDDTKLLTCGHAEVLKLWDVETVLTLRRILDLAVTPNGENLISIFSDKEIRILNLESNAERVIAEEHSISSLSISVDGKFFIVNLNNQEIHMWDVAGEWQQPLKYTGHQQNKYVIRSCFGGVNSAFIASGSENSEVYIWSRQSSKPIEVLSGHSTTVNCVSWNPKRPKMLASASDDQTIRIWGPASSKNIKPGQSS